MSPAFMQRTREERSTSRISATLRALAISCAHKHTEARTNIGNRSSGDCRPALTAYFLPLPGPDLRHVSSPRMPKVLLQCPSSSSSPSPPSSPDLGHVYLLCALIGQERVHTV